MLRAILATMVIVLEPIPPVVEPPVQPIKTETLRPFCHKHASHPACSRQLSGGTLLLDKVTEIDAAARLHYVYKDDVVKYGEIDFWADDDQEGDCEDYALLLARKLAEGGESGTNMALILWWTTPTTAHATLAIRTVDKGWMEAGVGPVETPAPLRWERGVRYAWMRLDGRRQWRIGVGGPDS